MGYMETYERWLNSPVVDEKSKAELLAIKGDEKEIEERFYRELEFGTAGMRGILGAGINRINIYNVRQASMGVAKYVKLADGAAKGVLIGYDTRHMSREFAEETAKVLADKGIITNKDLWLGYCGDNTNVYWFCRKLCQYVRTKPSGEKADREYKNVGEIIWDLHHRGIITDKELWTNYMNRDKNVYWLLQKSLHWCRTH